VCWDQFFGIFIQLSISVIDTKCDVVNSDVVNVINVILIVTINVINVIN
jgi:hypothetical protein